MKKSHSIPNWKYWLSYIKEVHIESAPSSINPHLYVSLDRGKMQLCTENAVYSYEDRYDNFRLLFDQINLGEQNIKQVLILGLGLGSVPLLVELSGLQVDHMAFVEVDKAVVYLAEKYGLNRIEAKYTVYQADAEVFLKVHSDKYDLIVSDIFLDDKIPDYFLSPDYLEGIKNVMNPECLVIMNTLASTSEDKQSSRAYFDQVFSKMFPQGGLTHVWENYMLMNRPAKILDKKIQIKTK